MSASALRIVEGSSMDKTKAHDAALSQIERNFGKGSIMRLGKTKQTLDVDTVSSGSLGLDVALGIGGLGGAVAVDFMGCPHCGHRLNAGCGKCGRLLNIQWATRSIVCACGARVASLRGGRSTPGRGPSR